MLKLFNNALFKIYFVGYIYIYIYIKIPEIILWIKRLV